MLLLIKLWKIFGKVRFQIAPSCNFNKQQISCEVLQSGPGDQLPVLWAEHDRLQELVSALRRLQGPAPVRPARTSILPIFEKWALENKAIYKEVCMERDKLGPGICCGIVL